MQNPQTDPGLRVVQLVSEMVEYRNEAISVLSRDLKRGIVHLHREQSVNQHTDQFKELKGIIDQISRLIADNNFDVNQLKFSLAQPPEKENTPAEPEKSGQLHNIHYIQ